MFVKRATTSRRDALVPSSLRAWNWSVRLEAYVSLSVLMVKNCGVQLQSELSSLHSLCQFVSRVGDGVQAEAEVEVAVRVAEGVLDGVEGVSSGQWLLPPSCGPLQGFTEQQPFQSTSGDPHVYHC